MWREEMNKASNWQTREAMENFIETLLEKQRQEHKKEIEQVIEAIPDNYVGFGQSKMNLIASSVCQDIKHQLRTKYLKKEKV